MKTLIVRHTRTGTSHTFTISDEVAACVAREDYRRRLEAAGWETRLGELTVCEDTKALVEALESEGGAAAPKAPTSDSATSWRTRTPRRYWGHSGRHG